MQYLPLQLLKLPSLQPDAEFMYKETLLADSAVLRGALEVELTRKSADANGLDRNVKRYLRYNARPEISLVVWVCGSESVKFNLQKVLGGLGGAKIKDASKHRFLLFNEVLKKGLMNARDAFEAGYIAGIKEMEK